MQAVHHAHSAFLPFLITSVPLCWWNMKHDACWRLWTGDAGSKLSLFLRIRRCAIRCVFHAAQTVATCRLHLAAITKSLDIGFVCNILGISMSAALTRATPGAVPGTCVSCLFDT